MRLGCGRAYENTRRGDSANELSSDAAAAAAKEPARRKDARAPINLRRDMNIERTNKGRILRAAPERKRSKKRADIFIKARQGEERLMISPRVELLYWMIGFLLVADFEALGSSVYF